MAVVGSGYADSQGQLGEARKAVIGRPPELTYATGGPLTMSFIGEAVGEKATIRSLDERMMGGPFALPSSLKASRPAQTLLSPPLRGAQLSPERAYRCG